MFVCKCDRLMFSVVLVASAGCFAISHTVLGFSSTRARRVKDRFTCMMVSMVPVLVVCVIFRGRVRGNVLSKTVGN